MKHVALLFDDGPDFANSMRLLDILKRADVRVSLAQVGVHVRAHPGMTRAAAAAGHQIVNHSMTHGHIKEMDEAELRTEILAPLEVFESAIGHRPAIYWAPYIAHDARMKLIVKEGGMHLLMPEGFHFVSSEDWNREATSRDGIVSNSLAGLDDPALEMAGDRRLILFHEWRDDTLLALPEILQALKERDYTFVTIDELLALDAETVASGIPPQR